MNPFFSILNPTNTMSINRLLARAIGLQETVFFQALLSKFDYYERNNMLDEEGYFYCTTADMEESTTLARKTQDRSVSKLVSLGLVECKVKGLPAKKHFKINPDISVLISLLQEAEIQFVQKGQTDMSETDKLECPKGTNQSVQNGQQIKSNKSRDNKSITKSINQSKELIDKIDRYRELIEDNISCSVLTADGICDPDELNEIVEIMTDAVTSTGETVRVGKEDKPVAVVAGQLLKLDSRHVIYVLECLAKNTKPIKNIRSYLLTALYNAPKTMSSYYKAEVQSDLFGGAT